MAQAQTAKAAKVANPLPHHHQAAAMVVLTLQRLNKPPALDLQAQDLQALDLQALDLQALDHHLHPHQAAAHQAETHHPLQAVPQANQSEASDHP